MKKKLILFLLVGISSCVDNDYVYYLNFFYINHSGYDFEKIEVFRFNKKGEYKLNNNDTLKIFTTDYGDEIILMNADSVNIYYNGTVKQYIHSNNDPFSPLYEKYYEREIYGKHDTKYDYTFVFSKKDFE